MLCQAAASREGSNDQLRVVAEGRREVLRVFPVLVLGFALAGFFFLALNLFPKASLIASSISETG